MEVMAAAAHMCCVCRTPGGAPQIHHIDKDPSNNERSNLAVLCAAHHSAAHERGGFGRALDPRLVAYHRSAWEAAVRHRRGVAGEGTPAGDGQAGTEQPLLRYLRELLTVDFSWEGTFRGEFGEFSALEDEQHFQLPGRESLRTKPRLFHTYWGLVGSRELLPRLFPEQAASTTRRLADRFAAAPWIETSVPDYRVAPIERARTVRSVRHTAKAASILLLTEGGGQLVGEIVWTLVETAAEFTNPDGGCREELVEQPSSIYASAYLLQLFSSLIAQERFADTVPEFDRWRRRAEELLDPLHAYLESSWANTRWDWGDVPWQVNAPYIIADAGPWLRAELRREVRAALHDELTPAGRLRNPDLGEDLGAPEPLRALRTVHALRGVSDAGEHDPRSDGLLAWLLKQDWGKVRLRPCDVTFLADCVKDSTV